MKKKIIAVITAVAVTAAVITACGDKKPAETSEQTVEETTVAVTETEEPVMTIETIAETVVETSEQDEGGIPQPGDTYNGHTVDHTEDQPNCDDASHGTIWIFYTDSDAIDYIEY